VELYLHHPNTPSWGGAQLRESTDTVLFFIVNEVIKKCSVFTEPQVSLLDLQKSASEAYPKQAQPIYFSKIHFNIIFHLCVVLQIYLFLWGLPIMGRDLDSIADILMGFHRSTFSKPNAEFNSDSPHAISGFFQP
jgi:hypothetical protein